MQSRSELEESIKGMQSVEEEIQQAIKSKKSFDYEDALNRRREAAKRYERAVLAEGWLPAFPPLTPEGEERWGFTEEEKLEYRKFYNT